MKTKSFLKPMLLFLLLWMISLKTHSQIIVDSFDIDYPECTNCLLPEQEGPAMTITVKHYRLANLPASGNAAVIFVPGGGFIVINPQGLEDPNPNNPGSSHNIDVAKHLALDSVHVWSVSYTISNSLDLTKMVTGENCGMATQFSKGDFEFASLKAFWSFRKLLSEFKTDSFPAYGIDTNKVFLVGHSAGAILSIYSTFLGANDMPTQLMSNSSFNPSNNRKRIPSAYRTQYFPVMRFKGIMPMSGGSLYTNIFDDNTELFGSNGMAIYLLHGTCDEMLHPDVERLPARCPNRPTLPNFDTHRMNWTASSSNNTRYPIGYGSSWIFKKLWADSAKVLYEQVCEGGHDILQYSMRGSWNYEGQPFDINDPRNNYNPVFLRIEDFVLKTLGKRSPGFIKGLTGFVPDSTNAKCTNESDPLKTDTTWAITADSLTYGWEGTCANRYIYAQKKGRETIVYRWRFYQGNTPVTGWLSTIEPKLNVNFVPVNSTYTVKLQTQNGCGLGGIQSKTISFTPFSCRMAGAVDEEIPNSITNALSEPDNIDGEWLRIVDMGGRVILEGKFPLESDWQQVFIYELDVPSGIYIVQQLRENKIMNTKIFKP